MKSVRAYVSFMEDQLNEIDKQTNKWTVNAPKNVELSILFNSNYSWIVNESIL